MWVFNKKSFPFGDTGQTQVLCWTGFMLFSQSSEISWDKVTRLWAGLWACLVYFLGDEQIPESLSSVTVCIWLRKSWSETFWVEPVGADPISLWLSSPGFTVNSVGTLGLYCASSFSCSSHSLLFTRVSPEFKQCSQMWAHSVREPRLLWFVFIYATQTEYFTERVFSSSRCSFSPNILPLEGFLSSQRPPVCPVCQTVRV